MVSTLPENEQWRGDIRTDSYTRQEQGEVMYCMHTGHGLTEASNNAILQMLRSWDCWNVMTLTKKTKNYGY